MKSVLLSLWLTVASTRAFCQTVNGIPIQDISVEYVQIVGTEKTFGTKFTVEIDFGQENQKDTKIRDENDRPLEFNSMIDALNFMASNGYEFVQAYTIMTGKYPIHYYMLKRRR